MKPWEPPFKEANYRVLLRQMFPHRHHSLAVRMTTRRLIAKSRRQTQ